MSWERGLREVDGNFATQARLIQADVKVDSLVFIDGSNYVINTIDAGVGILLNNGLYANPKTSTTDPQTAINTGNITTNTGNITTNTTAVLELTKRTIVDGVVTTSIGLDYFASVDATITMADVTGFVGGERFSIVAGKGVTGSTLTVDGAQGEEIEPANGVSTDTAFNLTTVGVSFEFIFNAVTGNWEV